MKRNKVYLMDCIDFLNKIENKSIDLVVVDPPYNLKKAKWDTFKNQTDFLKFTYSWIDAVLPKLKDTGSLYIFNTSLNSAYILQHLVEKDMIFQNWIVWDKRDGLASAKNKYVNGQETILFFTKSKKYTFNYDDIRIPYDSEQRINHAKKKGILKNGKRWFPNSKGKLCTDVWHYSSERHKQKINGKTQRLNHITPKPVDLIERIIIASSNKNDLVLDCFMGIGTTAIACKKTNRNFIGCDNNQEYIRLTNNSLKKWDYINRK